MRVPRDSTSLNTNVDGLISAADIFARMPDDPKVHHVSDDDAASSYESAVVDAQGPGHGEGRIAIDRGGPDARVASADTHAGGQVTDRIEGRASHKDQAELRAAQNLVSRINEDGEDWGSPEHLPADARTERGVDCIAYDSSGHKLQIQVTTTEREVWYRASEEVHERSAEKLSVVEAVRTAIEAKANYVDREIALALDATDSPRAALRAVVEIFREKHGDWAASAGWQAIWLVGPTPGLVHRLDAGG